MWRVIWDKNLPEWPILFQITREWMWKNDHNKVEANCTCIGQRHASRMANQAIYPCHLSFLSSSQRSSCPQRYCVQKIGVRRCKLSETRVNLRRSRHWAPTEFLSKVHGIRAVASSGEGGRGNLGEAWKGLFSMTGVQEFIGEKLMRMVAGATAAPVGQFIASPTTFLHSLDPRVKQAWLLALVVLPSRSPMLIRLSLVLFLALLSMWTLPRNVWQDQLGRMTLLSSILFVMLAVSTDGVPPLVQMRTPPPSMLHLPNLPPALGGYSYVVLKLGPLQLTRKGLSLATTTSCLSFTILLSASLCLTTTTPEQLAAALRWYMLPSARLGAPVDEIVLTLLLSLRFVSLVFDEVRNLALGIVARGIQWKNLTALEAVDILFLYLRRIFNNLFNHAEQISQAMIARGFRGNAANHKIYLFTNFSLQTADVLAIVLLGALIGLAILYENFVF